MRAGFRSPRTGDEPRTGGRLAGKALQGRTYLDCWPSCHVARGMSLRAVRNWVMKPCELHRGILTLSWIQWEVIHVLSAGLRPDLICFLKVPLSVEKEIRWGRWWALGQGCGIQSQMCTFYLPAAILEWMVCIYIFWSISFGLLKRPIFPLALNFNYLLILLYHVLWLVSWNILCGMRIERKKEEREERVLMNWCPF